MLRAALLAITAFVSTASIIVRHDVSDEAYIAFAESLPESRAVVRYNETDVAGTLIASRWILSAGHVAETIDTGQYVYLHTGDSVEVEAVILHPGWIADGRPEDIALVRLRREVEEITTVPLYTERSEAGEHVVIIGNGAFGTGRDGPRGNDGVMRAATNRVDDATEDYLIWRFDDPAEEESRATTLEGISGPGDSGGPALIKVGDSYHLAGISSGQSTRATNGREGLYGVTEYYSRVSTYIDWIRQHISD